MSNDNKTRDLFTDGFTTGDFVFEGMSRGASAQAKKVANQLLSEALASAQVVYGEQDETYKDITWADSLPNGWATHTARLVAVRKLEEA